MATHLPQQRATQKTEIPDKLYFRIGEVARLCSVAPYVLRFWETEFTQLKPNKSGTGQRLYRRRDVEMALRVKRLLYDEGYTIAGARQAIQAESSQQTRRPAGTPVTATTTGCAAGGSAPAQSPQGIARDPGDACGTLPAMQPSEGTARRHPGRKAGPVRAVA